jgi:hypothetical protein
MMTSADPGNESLSDQPALKEAAREGPLSADSDTIISILNPALCISRHKIPASLPAPANDIVCRFFIFLLKYTKMKGQK